MIEKKNHLQALESNIGPSNPTLSIFLISVLGLFLEMMLIRWIGTEIRIFAYLQNTILVTCFLGLGIGCFTARQPINLRAALLPLLVLVLILTVPFSRQAVKAISPMLSTLQDFVIWSPVLGINTLQTVLYVTLGSGLTFGLMLLILDIFVPIGRLLGRLMDDHPRTIWAYSANVGGSLVGIWLFVSLSMLCQPPAIWFGVLGILMLFFLAKPWRTQKLNIAILIAIVILSAFSGAEFGSLEVIWSPYQKLILRETNAKNGEIGKYHLDVNNADYQEIIDLRHDLPAAGLAVSTSEGYLSQYSIPMLLHPNPKKVLIVGAGTGNDVAGALRYGATKVTAVEIDPAIAAIGKRYHPERPYESANVRIVVDDARAFLSGHSEKYDVISFGLLDAHTATSMMNARLDHYVYTRESIQRAYSLLADRGVLTLTFYITSSTKQFMMDRMARVLRDVSKADPVYFMIPRTQYGRGGIMFVVGDQTVIRRQVAANSQLSQLIESSQKLLPPALYKTAVTTDDWPYLYLPNRSIPILFYLLIGLTVLLFTRSLWHWSARSLLAKWNRSDWHFFFLGAAFMLLEVQNISKASVALGNTWLVNAVIVSGVLLMILLANLIAARFHGISLIPVYVCLFGICLVLYFVDIARFAFLPYGTKAVIVGSLTTLPMIFSGIVFIRSFANASRKDEALGANLIGALVGALLQSITFVTGIRALLLIVLGLYFLAMLTKQLIAEGSVIQTFT
jgi:spermidine synthase